MKRGCREPLLSIVVPTFNERDNIIVLVPRIHRVLSPQGVCYEVIVVDDDSPDGTWRAAEGLAAEGYPVRVIRRVGRRGLGTAIVEGLAAARGRYVAVMDADLQHPPEVLPRLLEAATSSGADLVVATRYARGGGVAGWSRLRLAMSRVAGLLAHLLLPESRATSDPMSGFFLVRREALRGIRLEGRSWKVLLELLAAAPWLRVEEVPYVFQPREKGRSKLGPKAMLDYVLDLLRLSRYRVLRFALVGATGTLVNAVIAQLLASTGVPGVAALAASWEAGLLWNYMLHEAWTFKDLGAAGGRLGRLLRYHAASAAGFAAYLAAGSMLLAAGAPAWLAAVGGVAAGFTLNYAISATQVWAPQMNGQPLSPGERGGGL